MIVALQAAGEPARVIVESGPGLGGWEIAGIVAGMIAAGLAALAAWQATRASKAAAESLRLARREREEEDTHRVGLAVGGRTRRRSWTGCTPTVCRRSPWARSGTA